MRSSNESHVESKDPMQQLVYGISHDMGAPLRAVVQFSQLLEKRLDSRLDEKERYWLQLVQENGEKGQAMIEALLRYSRLNNPHKNVNLLLDDVVHSTIETCVRKCPLSEYACARDIKIISTLPEIQGCKDHWYLFFNCIISNALLYQPVKSENHTLKVRIHSEAKNGQTHITIEDNGIGVPESQRSDLTRPFMRGQSKEDYPGIGMGLCYCERIAQLHGGRLHFSDSQLGGLRVIYSF